MKGEPVVADRLARAAGADVPPPGPFAGEQTPKR
jgi:hypothetical protein